MSNDKTKQNKTDIEIFEIPTEDKKYSPRIGVITDDLTGGGDIGVQFADKGLDVLLSIDVDTIKDIPYEAEVWIINTNSRSVSEHKAIKSVKKAVGLLKNWNAQYFYKKIDSTLRGNIGVELEEFARSLEIRTIPVCAAFPDMGRTTKNSIHYVHGEKVSESSYSEDVKSPVTESNIRKLLARQMKNPQIIEVKDACTNEDLENLSKETTSKVFAGAAAWAGKLADLWLTSTRQAQSIVLSPGPVLIISGSLNPTSLEQIKFWEKAGFLSFEIDDSKKSIDIKEDIILKTAAQKDDGSLKKLNKAAVSLWNSNNWDRVILNGGDTAYHFMDCIGAQQVKVVKSLLTGIALVQYENRYIVLKPGGYGQQDTFVELARLVGGK